MNLLSLFVVTAMAATSQMSYEGVLTDVAGAPVTAPTVMSVRITDGASCVVHSQSFGSVTPDSSGFFSLKISGLIKAMFELPGACVGSSGRYLELTVDGEVFPLIEMDSTPYTMVAGTAQEATTLVGAMGASSTGQVLTWNGSSWLAQTPSAGAETDPTVPGWAKSPALAVADVPVLDTNKIASGTLPVVRGGTGTSSLPTCSAAEFLRFDGSDWTCGTPSTAAETDPTIPQWAKTAPAARLTTTGNILDLAGSGVTAGTYTSVTVDAFGRVTAGTSPTTLAGYGIADAIQNGGGIPSISTGTLASRPTFGTVGRLYLATDKSQLFRDTGSAWNAITIPNVITKETGSVLTAVGYNAGINSTGNNNAFFGAGAGFSVVTGIDNSAFGTQALQMGTGTSNVAVGTRALQTMVSGNLNTVVGADALPSSDGNGNTVLGFGAGANVQSTSGTNILIGRMAGPATAQTINSKLYIHNNVSDTPLIYGDFLTSALKINGTLTSTGTLTVASPLAYFNYKPNNTECTNQDLLAWDATNDRWICQTPSGGGTVTSVSGIGQITVTGSAAAPIVGLANGSAAGQALRWNGSAWATQKISSGDLSDMSATAPSNGQVLKWNGSQWAPAADDSGMAGTVLQNGNSFGGTMTIGTNDNSALAFEINGSELARFSTAGRFGINTAGPNTELEVRGASATPGNIATDYIYLGPWATATQLTATGGPKEVRFPSAVPSSGTEGVMIMSGSSGAGQMSWRTCSSGQFLIFNGSAWICADQAANAYVSDHTKSIEILVANCSYGTTCTVTDGGSNATPNYFRMIRFTNLPGSGAMQLNVASYQAPLYKKPGTQILASDLTNGAVRMVVFKNYDGATTPITNQGWYYDGGDAENGDSNDNIYHMTAAGMNVIRLMANGTVSVANGFTQASGTGTTFTSDFKVGDYLAVGSETRQIAAISTDTLMTVTSAFSSDRANSQYGKVTSSFDNGWSSDLTLRAPQQNASSSLKLVSQTNTGGNEVGSISYRTINNATLETEVSKISSFSEGVINSGSLSLQTAQSGTLIERVRISSQGNVGVGTVSPTERLHVAGNLRIDGHLKSVGTTPSLSCTSGTNSIDGTDIRGRVTMLSLGVSSCTVTFYQSYSSAPYCVVSWTGSPSAGGMYATTTNSAMTVTFPGNTSSGTTFTYICME